MFAKTALISLFFGRNQEIIAETTARGATQVATPKALAQAIDIVTLSVTTSEVVESLIYGDDGIRAGFNEGAVIIDYGTSIPASTQKVGADLATKSVGMTMPHWVARLHTPRAPGLTPWPLARSKPLKRLNQSLMFKAKIFSTSAHWMQVIQQS